MSKQWQEQREHGNPFLLNLLMWIALNLGRRVIVALLYPIVFYYFLVATKARYASRLFLTRALQRAPQWWEIYRHLFVFAVVSIDRIYFLAGRGAYFDVRSYGQELVNGYKERGCILLTSHLGSAEALRVTGVRDEALSIQILLDIQHNANALNLIQRLDPELASNMIDARTPGPTLVLKLSEAIEKGNLVGIMADRCAQGERTMAVEFLGKNAKFPQGVWQLASLLRAPVVACFGIYRGGRRYDLHFELISEQLGSNRADRPPAIAAGMSLYCTHLENFARTYPYNWFNFYDFWQDETTQHH
jgi:predicted LPLAT superfamily acyltransferase